MKIGLIRAMTGAAAICGVASASVPAQAANFSRCVTDEEAAAFSLRHLQSRLMVAALACNQRDAYNSFVEAFRPSLAASGADLITYFQRTGGGQNALNRHITDLANVAGLLRAEDPNAYCQQTWNTFLQLQDDPSALMTQAVGNMFVQAGSPALCNAPAPPPVVTAAAPAPLPAATPETASIVQARATAPAVAPAAAASVD
jgi:hypothetical protein